jgi:hypothetical protein
LLDRRYGGQLYRPAQFGDWLSMRNLNAEYDAAKPDTVIVTFGADDVHFVDIVTFCATGYAAEDADAVEALAALRDPGAQIRANFNEKFPTLEAIRDRPQRLESSYCTAKTPGSVIENEFWDPINNARSPRLRRSRDRHPARGQKAARFRASCSRPTPTRARRERVGRVPRPRDWPATSSTIAHPDRDPAGHHLSAACPARVDADITGNGRTRVLHDRPVGVVTVLKLHVQQRRSIRHRTGRRPSRRWSIDPAQQDAQ